MIEYDTPNERLTPERLAKGDVDYSLYANGSIRNAQAKDITILAALVHKGKLGDAEVSTAHTFIDWRAAHSTDVDGRPFNHEGIGAPGEYTKADYYRLLIRIVPKMHTDLIVMSCDTAAKAHAFSEALRDPSPYQTAYEWVGRAMGSILRDYEEVFNRLAQSRK